MGGWPSSRRPSRRPGSRRGRTGPAHTYASVPEYMRLSPGISGKFKVREHTWTHSCSEESSATHRATLSQIEVGIGDDFHAARTLCHWRSSSTNQHRRRHIRDKRGDSAYSSANKNVICYGAGCPLWAQITRLDVQCIPRNITVWQRTIPFLRCHQQ